MRPARARSRTNHEQGRLKSLRTKPTLASGVPTDAGGILTTCAYHSQRGWLDNKRDAESKGADYTYTLAGRLKTRTWARIGTGGNRVTTTYAYDQGMLESITYANDPTATLNVSLTYDSFGRPDSISNGLARSAFTYDPATLAPDTETIAHMSHPGSVSRQVGIVKKNRKLLKQLNEVEKM